VGAAAWFYVGGAPEPVVPPPGATPSAETPAPTEAPPKLYWLIPDGLRAEPDLFDIYRWAAEGKLPNVKRMMETGTYGYSIPVFPSHTPANFATLLTGSRPKTHGINDGPMHAEGQPLAKVSVGGFRSASRLVPAAWSLFEESGRKVAVLSVPGSTPAEVDDGVVLRGRWGGVGGDTHAVIFETRGVGDQQHRQGRGARLFFAGPPLTTYVDVRPATGWTGMPTSNSAAFEASLAAWGVTVHAYLYDSTDDGLAACDRVVFSADKTTVLADLAPGDWSPWADVNLPVAGRDVRSGYLFHVIKLGPEGFCRLRVVFDNNNELVVHPAGLSAALRASLGPMIDFVDNFPAQLVFHPEDKATFLEEMNRSFDWHTRLIPFLWREVAPDVVIHDVYSPNQMLSSRWWTAYIDPASKRYGDVDVAQRDLLWTEVEDMYRRLDAMLGAILDVAGRDTIVVLSSDHGICALNRSVHLNNLFASKGLLRFTPDPETGVPVVDWKNTRAVYLKMIGVFVHPDGLDGNWTRGRGPAYESLREQVKALLLDLVDSEGTHPVASVTPWEQVEDKLGLYPGRVGDLVIANRAGYGWNEEMSDGMEVFSTPLTSGYKQAILPEEATCLWTPFVVTGPGVRPAYKLSRPISNVDQLPTLLKLLGVKAPAHVEGHVVEELME
jgi:predicted AlkP superfamily phosphohydrolase/phosphomutase